MENDKPSMGNGNVPFPQADKSKALRDEDAFMELHGGWSSCAIYALVDWLSLSARLPGRLLRPYRIVRFRTAGSAAGPRGRRQSLP